VTVPEAASARQFTLRADTAEARRAVLWLERTGAEHGVPDEQNDRLAHCLDEALANVIAHGGADARSADIVLRFEVKRDAHGGEAIVIVSDAGAPFDPAGAKAMPRPRTLAEATEGGLGLHLLRGFADRLSYRRVEDRNHLTFSVRWR
jgi:anti-sigma regulatory factor (Ser/Thr protein kinase)